MSAHFEKGRILYIQHRYSDAEQEFRRALAEMPDDSTTHAMLAAALDAQKKHDEAVREAKEAIKVDPENAFAFYALALTSLKSGRLKEAKSSIREAMRLDPDDPLFYSMAALIADTENEWPEMLKVAEQGLAIEPEDVDCINARAKALTHMGRTEEAAASLQVALQIDPENAETHSNMGWLLVRRGSVDAAIDHFREALRIEPDSQWAYEGVVEGLKARNPIYHMLLLFGLSFSSFSNRVQTWMYWVLWVIPPARALMLLGVIVYACGHAFFNLLLRLDPVGRRVLTDEAKRSNNYALGCIALIAALIGFGWYAEASNPEHRALDKASSLVAHGHVAEARRIWQKQLSRATSLAAGGKYHDAERILERLNSHLSSMEGEAVASDRVECLTALARLYLRQDTSHDKAAEYLEESLKLGTGLDPLSRAKIQADLELAQRGGRLEPVAGLVVPGPGGLQTPQEYLQGVQSRLKASWRPPVTDQDVDITVSFQVHADGKVSDIKLVKASPSAEANEQALAAIKAAAPFDLLPDTLKPVTEIQMTFDAARKFSDNNRR